MQQFAVHIAGELFESLDFHKTLRKDSGEVGWWVLLLLRLFFYNVDFQDSLRILFVLGAEVLELAGFFSSQERCVYTTTSTWAKRRHRERERAREREMFRTYVGFLIHKERRVASVSTSFMRLEAIIVNNMLQSV